MPCFLQGYQKNNNVIEGINFILEKMISVNPYKSRGYAFLIGKVTQKSKGAGALKRWNMYLRWMVRKDNIDMGLWKGVHKKDLILPLDTHTFKMGHKFGLLKRRTYDLQAALDLTKKLKSFDEQDPIKYDFALYRLGQES
nr:TIGR02757 family protein [Sulfurimonas sp. MAG313]